MLFNCKPISPALVEIQQCSKLLAGLGGFVLTSLVTLELFSINPPLQILAILDRNIRLLMQTCVNLSRAEDPIIVELFVPVG
jgi:hypothetical protein